MDLLRFLTAGSVDDGKSTLIGRLLYDSKSILDDQLAAIERHGSQRKDRVPDLALLTDGLRAEREQGITIDVAYRYFSTPKRKFIIADTPGHIQYTRNMITGASNTSLIIILIDARKGVTEQTRRHSIIASILKIPQVIVAVNKMDLIDYDQEKFEAIREAYQKVAGRLKLERVHYIPVSALLGDNVVEKSPHMSWYPAEPLLTQLETLELRDSGSHTQARFPVQYVIRPGTNLHPDYRGYAGQVLSGTFKKGDMVTVLPSGFGSTIKSVELAGTPVTEGVSGQSITLLLEDDLDVSRGDLIVKTHDQPQVRSNFEVLLCWLDARPLRPGNRYIVQANSTLAPGRVNGISSRLNIQTLAEEKADTAELNEVVTVRLQTATPLALDAYADNPANGRIILIDETTHQTVAAGLIQ